MLVKVSDGENSELVFNGEINTVDSFNDFQNIWNDYCDSCDNDWSPIVRVDGKRLDGNTLKGTHWVIWIGKHFAEMNEGSN